MQQRKGAFYPEGKEDEDTAWSIKPDMIKGQRSSLRDLQDGARGQQDPR